MSFSRPDTVGSFANWSRETVVDAPVRRRVEDRIRLARHSDFFLHHRLHRERQVGRVAEIDRDVVLRLCLEHLPAGIRSDDDRIRPADAHVRNDESAIFARHRFVRRARRQVNRDDAGALHRTLLRVEHDARDPAGGDALRERRRRQRKKCESRDEQGSRRTTNSGEWEKHGNSRNAVKAAGSISGGTRQLHDIRQAIKCLRERRVGQAGKPGSVVSRQDPGA
jgi:hypothetical protein